MTACVLGDFFGFQAFALEHVVKVGVAAKIELIRFGEFDAAFAEQAGEHAVGDGGANL